MLFSRAIIETVAAFLEGHRLPLVVDPVMVASSGARLLSADAVEVLVARLFPLATVVTPNLHEAEMLAGCLAARGASSPSGCTSSARTAVVVTGGHGEPAVDHLFDGERHVEIAVERHESRTTHGAGCTHSATLAALLARGRGARGGARGAAAPPRVPWRRLSTRSAPAKAPWTCSVSRLADLGELGLLAELERRGLARGIENDAAQVGGLVATADALVEDVHFRLGDISWRDLGFRAAAVNLSDLAASGPSQTVCSSCSRSRGDDRVDDVLAFYEGIAETGVPVVGRRPLHRA